MRTILTYISVLTAGLLVFLLLIHGAPSPENQILGVWKELSWEYEFADEKDGEKHITEDVKKSLGQDLIIHKAETWTFLPNGKLRLTGKNMDKTVSWRIKGRGHLLQILYDEDTLENYTLASLDDNTMNLNFETDVQARGIASLQFVRTEY